MRIKRFLVTSGIGLAMAGVAAITSWASAPEIPGLVIHAPPQGWNPVTATDSELEYYNFPPRPRNPDDLERWKSVVTNMQWVRPEFELHQPRIGPTRGEILTIHTNK